MELTPSYSANSAVVNTPFGRMADSALTAPLTNSSSTILLTLLAGVWSATGKRHETTLALAVNNGDVDM